MNKRKTPKVNLTKALIDALEPEDRCYFVRDLIPGFSLKVESSGLKVFMYKRRVLSSTDFMSLKQARKHCIEAQRLSIYKKHALFAKSKVDKVPEKTPACESNDSKKGSSQESGETIKSSGLDTSTFFYVLIFKWLEQHEFNKDKVKDSAERKRADLIIRTRFKDLFLTTIGQFSEDLIFKTLDDIVRNHADAAQRGKRYLSQFFAYLYESKQLDRDFSIYLKTLQISTKFKKVIIKA